MYLLFFVKNWQIDICAGSLPAQVFSGLTFSQTSNKLSLAIFTVERRVVVELYSRPLSPEAKEKLIEFIEAFIETLNVAEVDEKAELAKEKAIAVLNTDIDIVAFVTTSLTLLQTFPLVKGLTPRQVAGYVVELSEKARELDKSFRPGGGQERSGFS